MMQSYVLYGLGKLYMSIKKITNWTDDDGGHTRQRTGNRPLLVTLKHTVTTDEAQQ